MGGSGSGAHYYHWWRPAKKTTVEACLSLDANRWSREGVLKAGAYQSGSWCWKYRGGRECSIGYTVMTLGPGPHVVRLSYSWPSANKGERESAEYEVVLTTTRPRF